MKFTSFSLLALGLTSSVLATPTRVAREASVVQRDLSTMTSIISDISDQVGNLKSAIDSYSGGDISKVQDASDTLVSTIKKGTEKAKASDKLSSSDAFSLTSPVQDLIKKVQSTISDLNGKKAEAAKAGACDKVLSSLKEQKSAANDLADAITSKVPESFKDLAHKLSAGIANAIQKGIDAYKDCGGSGSQTTTGGSSGPTTTGGSGTTAAPTTTGGAGGSSSSSSPVIPTSSAGGSPGASSSGGVSPSASGSSGAGSGSGSGAPGPSQTVVPGAASKGHISYGLGAVAAALAVAL